MKTKIICFAMFLSCLSCNSLFAQQAYRFGYRFHPNYFTGNTGLELHVKSGNAYQRITFNFILKGTIDKRNGDTLHVGLWPSLGLRNSQLVVDSTSTAHDSTYIIIIRNWRIHRGKYEKAKFPYRHTQLTATTIPFRVKFRDSTTYEGEFLNANITFLWVRGMTKIYRSKFVESRHRVWAFGPFVGLSELENPKTEKNEFAANIGGNLIYGTGKLNFVFALGGEFGFSRETRRFNPYIGFGFGFSLAEVFEPEIESE